MRKFFYAIAAIVCGLVTALLGGVAVTLGIETFTVTDTPLRMDMAAAIERVNSQKTAWVQLTDASADCKRYAPFTSRWHVGTRQSGAFIAQNPAKDIEIAVVVHDIGQCAYLGAVHFIGQLKRMDADERKKFAADGLPLSETYGPQWWLCTWCVPEREWTELVTIIGFAIAFAVGARGLWRLRQPPVKAPAIAAGPAKAASFRSAVPKPQKPQRPVRPK
jgi:hypothetical protein